jgi:hypothetical protein
VRTLHGSVCICSSACQSLSASAAHGRVLASRCSTVLQRMAHHHHHFGRGAHRASPLHSWYRCRTHLGGAPPAGTGHGTACRLTACAQPSTAPGMDAVLVADSDVWAGQEQRRRGELQAQLEELTRGNGRLLEMSRQLQPLDGDGRQGGGRLQ